VDIATIRARIRAGNYLIKSHAIQHALKEGFERKHMVEAVLDGSVIEEYPEAERVLICGKTSLSQGTDIFLHVVCEFSDPVYTELVTAYIPNELEWERPYFRRRKEDR
jgi:hypothetical protein